MLRAARRTSARNWAAQRGRRSAGRLALGCRRVETKCRPERRATRSACEQAARPINQNAPAKSNSFMRPIKTHWPPGEGRLISIQSGAARSFVRPFARSLLQPRRPLELFLLFSRPKRKKSKIRSSIRMGAQKNSSLSLGRVHFSKIDPHSSAGDLCSSVVPLLPLELLRSCWRRGQVAPTGSHFFTQREAVHLCASAIGGPRQRSPLGGARARELF